MDASRAVRVGASSSLATHLQSLPTWSLEAPVEACEVGYGLGVCLVSVLPGASVPTATGLTLALSYEVVGTEAVGLGERRCLPPALLLAHLPYLLDGAILGVGCCVPVRVAGVALQLTVIRVTPSSAQLARCGCIHTRVTLTGILADPMRQMGAHSASAPAPLSPWKQAPSPREALRSDEMHAGEATPSPGYLDSSPQPALAHRAQPARSASLATGDARMSAMSTAERNSQLAPESGRFLSQVGARELHEGGRQCGASLASAGTPSASGATYASAAPADRADASIAGLDSVLLKMMEVIVVPSTAQGYAARRVLRVPPARGILLHGPPGCGKTQLVRVLASSARAAGVAARVFSAGAAELASPLPGEPERRLRNLFQRAALFARAGERGLLGGHAGSLSIREGGVGASPRLPRLALIFLDEVDALCPAPPPMSGVRASSASSRLAVTLLSLLDELGQVEEAGADRDGEEGEGPGASEADGTERVAECGRLVVVAATNRPEVLHPALRRPGRLDTELHVSPPGVDARVAILRLHAEGLRLTADARAGLARLAQEAIGFVGADLVALCREASMAAMQRAEEGSAQAEGGGGCVTLADLSLAARQVGASCRREMRPPPAATSWSDIGGAEAAVAALRTGVEAPLSDAPAYAAMGLRPPRGVLLHGPPGCAKTTLVRALASSLRASFLSLSPAEVLSPYVGESERRLRAAFASARAALPCLIFLDELDALVGRRGLAPTAGGVGGSHAVSLGILATLLTELDGLAGGEGILVVGATNRPAALDPALLRPGRLELHVHLGPPESPAGAAAVLAVHARGLPLEPACDLRALAAAAPPGLTGAQLEALTREAAMAALREALDPGPHGEPLSRDHASLRVARRHWDAALRDCWQRHGGCKAKQVPA